MECIYGSSMLINTSDNHLLAVAVYQGFFVFFDVQLF